MIIDEIEEKLIVVSIQMNIDKATHIKHVINLPNGAEYLFDIKRLR